MTWIPVISTAACATKLCCSRQQFLVTSFRPASTCSQDIIADQIVSQPGGVISLSVLPSTGHEVQGWQLSEFVVSAPSKQSPRSTHRQLDIGPQQLLSTKKEVPSAGQFAEDGDFGNPGDLAEPCCPYLFCELSLSGESCPLKASQLHSKLFPPLYCFRGNNVWLDRILRGIWD